jgi:hypothetical protein
MSLFLLNWKKVFLLLLFFIISLMLHYALTFLTNTQNPSFLILALIIIPVYFAVAILYSLIQIIISRRKEKYLNELPRPK